MVKYHVERKQNTMSKKLSLNSKKAYELGLINPIFIGECSYCMNVTECRVKCSTKCSKLQGHFYEGSECTIIVNMNGMGREIPNAKLPNGTKCKYTVSIK